MKVACAISVADVESRCRAREDDRDVCPSTDFLTNGDQRLENSSVGLLFQKSFNEKMTPSSFERVSSHC